MDKLQKTELGEKPDLFFDRHVSWHSSARMNEGHREREGLEERLEGPRPSLDNGLKTEHGKTRTRESDCGAVTLHLDESVRRSWSWSDLDDRMPRCI